jgi:hypothetical protein
MSDRDNIFPDSGTRIALLERDFKELDKNLNGHNGKKGKLQEITESLTEINDKLNNLQIKIAFLAGAGGLGIGSAATMFFS